MMAGRDYYCAFCGSTFSMYQLLAQRSRSDYMRTTGHSICGQEDDGYDPEDFEGYDPEVVSWDKIRWLSVLQCIGVNNNAPTLRKAFISGCGEVDDYGDLDVEPGDDQNFPHRTLLSAYRSKAADDIEVYPFHYNCFQLLLQVFVHESGGSISPRSITGIWATADFVLDKELLYSSCKWASSGLRCRLGLSYGEPEPSAQQLWEARPGEELFVADHLVHNELIDELIHDVWISSNLRITLAGEVSALAKEPKSDPFRKLPFELLAGIFSELDSRPLLNLAYASPHVHRVSRDARFWLERFQTHMPWFFELQIFVRDLLGAIATKDLDDNAENGNSLRYLYAWAESVTSPRLHMTSPFIGIANRRRIWGVCKQLTDRYLTDQSLAVGEIGKAPQLRSQTISSLMPVICHPKPLHEKMETAFFIQSWDDSTRQGKSLELFWDPENALVGMAARFAHISNRRLFGQDDAGLGRTVTSIPIEDGDWISGFILHLPRLDFTQEQCAGGCTRTAMLQTWVTGITVLFCSGRTSTLGNISSGSIMRPLLATAGMTVVGLMGGIAQVELCNKTQIMADRPRCTRRDVQRIIRLSLLQAYQAPDDQYESTAEEDLAIQRLRSRPLESMTWTNDCSDIFTRESILAMDMRISPISRGCSTTGFPIWDIPELRIQKLGIQRVTEMVSRNLTAHEPLIWAKDLTESRLLRRLTGSLIHMATDSSMDAGSFRDTAKCLCGMQTEYASSSGLASRSIGKTTRSDPPDSRTGSTVHLDIDGEGGEVVASVSVAEGFTALKVVTNRGRESCWGGPFQRDSTWCRLTAPQGERLIGMVMSFEVQCGRNEGESIYRHCQFGSLAVLSLPT